MLRFFGYAFFLPFLLQPHDRRRFRRRERRGAAECRPPWLVAVSHPSSLFPV